MYSREELDSMNTNSVRGIASKSGIKNASSYKKNELIDLILHEDASEEWENDTGFDVDEETGEVMEFDAEPSICPMPVSTYDQENSIEEFEIPLDGEPAEEKPVSRSMQKKQKKHERLNKQNNQQEQAKEISFEHLNKKINSKENGETQSEKTEDSKAPSEKAESGNAANQEDAKTKVAEQQALDFDEENKKTQERATEEQPSAEELEKARRSAMAKHRGSTTEAPETKEEKVEDVEKVEINKKDALLIAITAVAILHSVFAIYDAMYEILWLGSTTIYWWYTVLMIGVLIGGIYMMKRENDSGQLIVVLDLIHSKTVSILSKQKEKGEKL